MMLTVYADDLTVAHWSNSVLDAARNRFSLCWVYLIPVYLEAYKTICCIVQSLYTVFQL